MDELYAFLFAGLIIFLMLFVFFGGPQITEKPNISEEIKHRIIELGTVSLEEESKEVTQVLDNEFEVHNGIFFGSVDYNRKFEIKKEILENLNKSTISFSVRDTNKYGKLSVSLNNETVYYKNSILGDYSFEINPIEGNLIDFKTTSSGWKIWAPSIYKISNLSLYLSYSLKEIPEYEFDVPPFIYNNFYKGDVMFTPIKSDKIRILVNENEIYNSVPSDVETIKFGKLEINLGENKIEFLSNEEYKLENVKIRLFYLE